MFKPTFIETVVDADGRCHSQDGFLCGHCQKAVTVKPFENAATANGFCSTCMSVICRQCAARGGCWPWEKAMEKEEARQRMLRTCGL